MAKGFKAGAGGGAPLNFKVVGNPQPASPKENTIWLNTDKKITSWAFRVTQPLNPAEGMVHIPVGTSSVGAFNALKKNAIFVYPIFAKQYINGAWVMVEAKIYQGGAWVSWFDGVIFKNGAKNDNITGGWNGYTSGAVLTVNKSNSPTTKNYIDLTGFKRLYVTFASANLPTDGAGNTAGSYGIRVYLSTASGATPAQIGAVAAGTQSIDISNVDEPVMIKCDAHTWNNGGSGTISAIWCE